MYDKTLRFQELGHGHLWEATILPTTGINLANVSLPLSDPAARVRSLDYLIPKTTSNPILLSYVNAQNSITCLLTSQITDAGEQHTHSAFPSSQVNWSICHDEPLTQKNLSEKD